MGKNNVTIKDIALKTGFSKSTVSRVLLNDAHVSEEAREKILSCAKEINFKPNYFAKGLKTQKSKTIAFFVPSIEIMIYPAIIQAMEVETRNRGYLILLCDIQDDKKIALEYVKTLIGRVDGFIFSTAFSDTKKNEEIKAVIDSGVPCVSLLRVDDSPIPSVLLDNEEGSRLGVEYLIKKGKKKIAYLQGQEYLKLYEDRYSGFKNTLKNNGIELSDEYLWQGYRGSERVASEVVKEKIQSGIEVDAVLCASDNLAVDAIHALGELGLKVPQDISVIGYDNVPISELFIPKLTSIGQPFKEMGKKAVDVLIDMIESGADVSPEKHIFKPYFIERDTV